MNKFPIKEFLIGGILYSAIKYTSDNVSDIRISSAIAAFPIGLLSSILINDKSIKKYTKSYMINVFFMLITAFLFYLLSNYTSINRYLALIISFLCWMMINIFNVLF